MTGPLIALVTVGLVAIAIHAFAVMRFVQVTRDLRKGVLKPTRTVGELVGGVGIAFLGLTILVTWVMVGWGVYLHATQQHGAPPPEFALLVFPIPYVAAELLINFGFDFA